MHFASFVAQADFAFWHDGMLGMRDRFSTEKAGEGPPPKPTGADGAGQDIGGGVRIVESGSDRHHSSRWYNI